ncbi:MAG TPA: SIS domain-containing protein [Candidatus Altiarchaeales archaeon]|nr:SIS domain-containing protein [Candidatus Altiarchaeales archaeon]
MKPDRERRFSDEIVEQSSILSTYLKKYPSFFEKQRDVLDRLYELIEGSRAIHLYGKGRSGNAAVGLALRLKHFGYNVWFIGDVVKERIRPGDLVILFSGSGETAEVVDVAKRAKKDKANVAGITSYGDSTLSRYSDIVFLLPGGLEKRRGWEYLEAQLAPESAKEPLFYGGGEFETMAYLFQETLISAIGRYKKIPSGVVAMEHERDEIIENE